MSRQSYGFPEKIVLPPISSFYPSTYPHLVDPRSYHRSSDESEEGSPPRGGAYSHGPAQGNHPPYGASNWEGHRRPPGHAPGGFADDTPFVPLRSDGLTQPRTPDYGSPHGSAYDNPGPGSAHVQASSRGTSAAPSSGYGHASSVGERWVVDQHGRRVGLEHTQFRPSPGLQEHRQITTGPPTTGNTIPLQQPGHGQSRAPPASSPPSVPSPPSSSDSDSRYGSPAPNDPSTYPDAGEYLRSQLRIPDRYPVNLWSLPDPNPGERPPQPYPTLIKLAIYGSPRKILSLQGIYEAIEARFEWYRVRSEDQSWKNSIRHNLSLNQVFQHIRRPITEPGKGHYWFLDITNGEGNKRKRRRRGRNSGASNTESRDADDDDAGEGEEDSSPSNESSEQSELDGDTSTSVIRRAPYPGQTRATAGVTPARTSSHPYTSGTSANRPPPPPHASTSRHVGHPSRSSSVLSDASSVSSIIEQSRNLSMNPHQRPMHPPTRGNSSSSSSSSSSGSSGGSPGFGYTQHQTGSATGGGFSPAHRGQGSSNRENEYRS